MDKNEINRIKEQLKIIKKELINEYQEGYIGKKTYKYYLNDGTTKMCDEITKNKRCGDAVVIVPILENGNYLLIMELRPNTKEEVIFEFPAGMVDDGENFKEAALRELKEETGLVPKELVELEWHYQDQGCSMARIYTYLAIECTYKYEQELDAEEKIYTFEVSEGELTRMIENNEIIDANSKIAYYTHNMKRGK